MKILYVSSVCSVKVLDRLYRTSTIKPMPFVLRSYPDAKVYVAGDDITRRPWWRLTGYGAFLKSLVKRYGLEGRVCFTGPLNEREMCERYLKANVFVCPSSIENSPNSLGEAQLLGVPCVASYVGGIPDMMEGNEGNIYRFEEVEMLAQKICSLFMSEGKVAALKNQKVKKRHDTLTNAQVLLDLYHVAAGK